MNPITENCDISYFLHILNKVYFYHRFIIDLISSLPPFYGDPFFASVELFSPFMQTVN